MFSELVCQTKGGRPNFVNRGKVPNLHRYEAAFISCSNFNSSNRIRAAYSAHGPKVLSEPSPSQRGPVEKTKSNKNTLLLLIIKSTRFPNQPRICIIFLWMVAMRRIIPSNQRCYPSTIIIRSLLRFSPLLKESFMYHLITSMTKLRVS